VINKEISVIRGEGASPRLDKVVTSYSLLWKSSLENDSTALDSSSL
jgi:hypothetical protein